MITFCQITLLLYLESVGPFVSSFALTFFFLVFLPAIICDGRAWKANRRSLKGKITGACTPCINIHPFYLDDVGIRIRSQSGGGHTI